MNPPRTPERRLADRIPADDCAWLSSARFRPGPEVQVMEVSSWGASLDAPVRLLPGTRVELVLAGPGWQWSVEARVVHVRVSALTRHGPRYVAGVQFARRLEVGLLRRPRPIPARAG